MTEQSTTRGVDGDYNQTTAHRGDVVSQIDMQDRTPYSYCRRYDSTPDNNLKARFHDDALITPQRSSGPPLPSSSKRRGISSYGRCRTEVTPALAGGRQEQWNAHTVSLSDMTGEYCTKMWSSWLRLRTDKDVAGGKSERR